MEAYNRENSTYTINHAVADSLTLESLERVYRKMELDRPKKVLREVKLCKKHFKQLSQHFEKKDNVLGHGVLGSLYGVKVIVKPYLKKVRFYYDYI